MGVWIVNAMAHANGMAELINPILLVQTPCRMRGVSISMEGCPLRKSWLLTIQHPRIHWALFDSFYVDCLYDPCPRWIHPITPSPLPLATPDIPLTIRFTPGTPYLCPQQ